MLVMRQLKDLPGSRGVALSLVSTGLPMGVFPQRFFRVLGAGVREPTWQWCDIYVDVLGILGVDRLANRLLAWPIPGQSPANLLPR